MLSELKNFIMRGNVIDLAVGVIIGASFNKIVSSLVDDIIMPPLGLVLGKTDFSTYFIPLTFPDGRHFATLAEAKAAGVTTLNIGLFGNAVFQFVLVACAIFFFIVKPSERFKTKEQKSAPRQEALLEEIRDLLKKK